MSNKNRNKYQQYRNVSPIEKNETTDIENDFIGKQTEPISENDFGVVDNCLKLRVREEPNTDSETLAIINKGMKVTILSELNKWYEVSTETIEQGYCMKKFITKR